LVDMNILLGVAPAYDQNFTDPRITAIPRKPEQTIQALPYKTFPRRDRRAARMGFVQYFDQAIAAWPNAEDEIISGTQSMCNQVMSEKKTYIGRT